MCKINGMTKRNGWTVEQGTCFFRGCAGHIARYEVKLLFQDDHFSWIIQEVAKVLTNESVPM